MSEYIIKTVLNEDYGSAKNLYRFLGAAEEGGTILE